MVADNCYRGVGFATCLRLISSFLSFRPASEHLCLIPATRSPSKGEETKVLLEEYITDLSRGRKKFSSFIRGGTAATSTNNDSKKESSAEALSLIASRVTITPLSI